MSKDAKLTEYIKKCVGSTILVIDRTPDKVRILCSSGYFLNISKRLISAGKFDLAELNKIISLPEEVDIDNLKKINKANLN